MTDYKFRFAIWAAVSSDEQARKDKGSLEDQEKFGRAYGEGEGGVETAGPYIADGYPRTDYFDLTRAMEEIPPLKDAIEAIEADRYDVLITHNWDRFGELGHMLRIKFRQLKKQLKSARQSSRIIDPATYNPRADESAAMEMNYESAVAEYRINNIVRGFEVGVDKRVTTGRYSRAFPYGYTKISDAGELEVNPPVAQLLITLKDKFFEGLSLRDLEKIASASGVPSPEGLDHWDYMTIRGILSNPFYTGKVFKDRWKQVGKKISSNGKRYPVIRSNPNPTYYDGRHQALWTFEEYQRILIEMDERYRKNPRSNPRAFSGLLKCGVCGGVMTFKQKKYRCRKHPEHVAIFEADMEQGIGEALAEAIRHYTDTSPEAPSLDMAAKVKAALEKKIARVQMMMEDETYDYGKGKARVDELKAQIAATESDHEEYARRLAAHQRLVEMRKSKLIDLNALPSDFLTVGKEKTNRFLRDILESIEVSPKQTYKFNFR